MKKLKETINKQKTEEKQAAAPKKKSGKSSMAYYMPVVADRQESIDAKLKKLQGSFFGKPVNKVVAEGTRFVFDGSSYSRKLTVKAYAYTGGGRTAMGTQARVGEIAVDPSVIPLGTTVYIEGVGERRAEDTGGNIKGNTIDIYMNSEAECRSWGVRYITIYIK